MSGLRVIPTWRHGRERLYVCLTDGRNIAWYDREAARINLLAFGAMTFNFFIVNIVVSGLHSYAGLG